MQATRWATGLGQVFGYGLIGIGLLRALGGDFGGLWFVLLGFFLSSAASAERQSTELLESLRDVRVDDIMSRDPMRVPGSLTVDTFVMYAMAESRSSSWLVTGPAGAVTGLLGMDQLRSVRGEARRTTRIGELATAIDQAPTAWTDEMVVEVLQRFEGRSPRAIVRERHGYGQEVAGLLTPEDVQRAIEMGRIRGGAGDQRAPSAGRDANEGPVVP
jgi:hypothetical protein